MTCILLISRPRSDTAISAGPGLSWPAPGLCTPHFNSPIPAPVSHQPPPTIHTHASPTSPSLALRLRAPLHPNRGTSNCSRWSPGIHPRLSTSSTTTPAAAAAAASTTTTTATAGSTWPVLNRTRRWHPPRHHQTAALRARVPPSERS